MGCRCVCGENAPVGYDGQAMADSVRVVFAVAPRVTLQVTGSWSTYLPQSRDSFTKGTVH